MAQLIGQVYNVRHVPAEGDKKEKVVFSLGHRKAMQREGEMPNLFTSCVTYSPGIMNVLNEYFKSESKEDANHGKWLLITGHYHEYQWQPNPAQNKNHEQYEFEVKVTADMLRQAGFIFAQGSQTEFAMKVCPPQTHREFVVNGFEFVGNAERNSTPRTSVASGPAIRVAGVSADTATADRKSVV